MYIARDKSGTILISKDKPERMTSHWKSPNSNYFVCNKDFAKELFDIRWIDEPKEINISINNIII